MSDVNPNEQLINALLDNQLDAEQADRASKQIAADPKLSAMLADFTQQRDAIGELPSYRLGENFGDRVIEIATLGSDDADLSRPTPSSTVDWKRYAMSLAAIAALLMAMLVFQWTPGHRNSVTTVAQLNPGSDSGKEDSAKAGPAVAKDEKFKSPVPGSSPSVFADSMNLPFPKAAKESAALAGDKELKKRSDSFDDSVGDLATILDDPSVPGATKSRKQTVKTMASPLSGTAMTKPAAPKTPPAPPAIDQVWILEADERFTQDQLLFALASNSIELPEELQQSARKKSDDEFEGSEKSEKSDLRGSDDGGIYVAANAKQMKNALGQLSQSGSVTISAYQLPDVRKLDTKQDLAPKFSSPSSKKAPLTITPTNRAVAQRLRGNHFRGEPLASSIIPETFEEQERKMRGVVEGMSEEADIADLGNSPLKNDNAGAGAGMAMPAADVAVPPAKFANADDDGVADSEGTAAGAAGASQKEMQADMKELFPDENLESQELKNFLILIRSAPAK